MFKKILVHSQYLFIYLLKVTDYNSPFDTVIRLDYKLQYFEITVKLQYFKKISSQSQILRGKYHYIHYVEYHCQ